MAGVLDHDPEDFIQRTFEELRRLYADGYKEAIRNEILCLTDGALHGTAEECASELRNRGYHVFDNDADVISDYLTYEEDSEITDLAAEAVVRRLASGSAGVCELAHLNSWLESFGFEPLTRKVR
jgi:hypothetical protein